LPAFILALFSGKNIHYHHEFISVDRNLYDSQYSPESFFRLMVQGNYLKKIGTFTQDMFFLICYKISVGRKDQEDLVSSPRTEEIRESNFLEGLGRWVDD